MLFFRVDYPEALEHTSTVLPAPCTPLRPMKNGGVLPGCRSVWARNRLRRNGMQCCDLSSIISGILNTVSSVNCSIFGSWKLEAVEVIS